MCLYCHIYIYLWNLANKKISIESEKNKELLRISSERKYLFVMISPTVNTLT
jgi:hypothetical protein